MEQTGRGIELEKRFENGKVAHPLQKSAKGWGTRKI